MPTLTGFQDKGVVVKNNKDIENQSGLIQPIDRKYKEHGENRHEHIEFKRDDTSHALRTNQIPVTAINVIGNYSPSGHDASRIVDSAGLAPTVKENHGTVTATNYDLRIRKLTPKECWRLMGFTDQEFEKAQKVNSNAQLYKQAGNSIVVNVLEKILEQLLLKDKNDFEGQITFEIMGEIND